MPPLEWPMACFSRALSVAVDLDDGGVDHGVFHVRIVGDGVEEPFENVGPDLVAEPRDTLFRWPNEVADRAMRCRYGQSTTPPR